MGRRQLLRRRRLGHARVHGAALGGARAPTTRPARRRRRRRRAHRPAAASLVTPDCARGPPHRSLPTAATPAHPTRHPLQTSDSGDGAGTVVTQVPAGTEPPYVPPSDGACANNGQPDGVELPVRVLVHPQLDELARGRPLHGLHLVPRDVRQARRLRRRRARQNAVYPTPVRRRPPPPPPAPLRPARLPRSSRILPSAHPPPAAAFAPAATRSRTRRGRRWGTTATARASLFQRLLDPSCDYVDSKYRDGTMLVPSCILDDPLLNPNGLNDCVTGICYDGEFEPVPRTRSRRRGPARARPTSSARASSPTRTGGRRRRRRPSTAQGLIPDGGRCGEDVPGAGICRHCCGATGFCGSSGLYCDADKGNQIGYSLQLINPYRGPDSPPPAPPPTRRRRGGEGVLRGDPGRAPRKVLRLPGGRAAADPRAAPTAAAPRTSARRCCRPTPAARRRAASATCIVATRHRGATYPQRARGRDKCWERGVGVL